MTSSTIKDRPSISVSGATSADGRHYVKVTRGTTTAFVQLAEFAGDGRVGLASLGARSITVIGRKQANVLVEQIAALDDELDFPPMDLLEQTGWSGKHFVLANGKIVSPPLDRRAAAITFTARGRKRIGKGSLPSWKRDVATLLTGMPVPMFVLSIAFIGPLLRFTMRAQNPGWELCGHRGCGKSTLQRVAASVWGDPDLQVASFDATRNGFEQLMAKRSDGLLLLDEVNLYMQNTSKKARAAGRRDLAFQLNNGSPKLRFGDSDEPKRYNFSWLTSANDTLADALVDYSSELALPALDRWMSIPIPTDDAAGVFSPLPQDRESGQIAAQLRQAVARNHGHAGRRFIKKLVAYNAADSTALERRIEEHLAAFRAAAFRGTPDGSTTRVLDAFGMSYTAASLAVHLGILPGAYATMEPALRCFELHRAVPGDESHAIASIKALVTDPRTIDLRERNVRDITSEEADQNPLLVGSSGRTELLLTDAAFAHTFSRPGQILLDRQARARFKIEPAEPGRMQVRRWVTATRHERVYAIDVTEWMESAKR